MKLRNSLLVTGLLVALLPSAAWANGTSSSISKGAVSAGSFTYPHAIEAKAPSGMQVPDSAKIYTTADDPMKVDDWYNTHVSAKRRAGLTVRSYMGKTYIIEATP